MHYNWTNKLVMVICGADQPTEPAHNDNFPPVDIVIKHKRIYIRADIPGVKPEDVCVYINNERLVIEGVKRPYYPPCSARKFSRVERQYRPFKREIRLNHPVNADAISTEFEDGVLLISWTAE